MYNANILPISFNWLVFDPNVLKMFPQIYVLKCPISNITHVHRKGRVAAVEVTLTKVVLSFALLNVSIFPCFFHCFVICDMKWLVSSSINNCMSC